MYQKGQKSAVRGAAARLKWGVFAITVAAIRVCGRYIG